MEVITHIVDRVLLRINKTFHITTCAIECCNNRCECKNEGESASSGEEVSIPQQHHKHNQEPESKIIFSSRLEILQPLILLLLHH